MQNADSILNALRLALELEPRVRMHRSNISLELADDGSIVLKGEADSLSARALSSHRPLHSWRPRGLRSPPRLPLSTQKR